MPPMRARLTCIGKDKRNTLPKTDQKLSLGRGFRFTYFKRTNGGLSDSEPGPVQTARLACDALKPYNIIGFLTLL